jgi:hypothetical protein
MPGAVAPVLAARFAAEGRHSERKNGRQLGRSHRGAAGSCDGPCSQSAPAHPGRLDRRLPVVSALLRTVRSRCSTFRSCNQPPGPCQLPRHPLLDLRWRFSVPNLCVPLATSWVIWLGVRLRGRGHRMGTRWCCFLVWQPTASRCGRCDVISAAWGIAPSTGARDSTGGRKETSTSGCTA